MKLSQKQFDQLLQKNKLILSLIGMSNIGKTHWSKKLARMNFKHINCDDLIEARLVFELKACGHSGIKDVSLWMGQPYSQRFSACQQKYLEFEKEVMKQIFAQIKNKKKQNIVIDTTGSFVHVGGSMCSQLKKHSLVIYIKANDSAKEKMFEQYIKKPKPVVFGDIFVPKKGETNKQALKKCYLELLNLRSVLYAQCADIIIPREVISQDMDAKQFTSLIRKFL